MTMLDRLKKLPRSIRVGIIGVGSIGKGIFLQSHITPGMECVAVADIKIDRAIACAEWLGKEYVVVDSLEAMHKAISSGKIAICESGDLVARCELMDVMIESSNAVSLGARYALAALETRKHVVMMNYEADLMFGPLLLHTAKQNGLVYSACDGDQPAVLRRLVDEIEFMGFELVMAGNIKGFLDRYTNPTLIVPEAKKRDLDPKMCASYTDGTKLCIEMAVLANALGLRALVPGMLGPRTKHVLNVFDVYDLEKIWQDRQPVVDYILGAEPTGGVYVIGYTDNKYQQETLAWFPPKMGPGPFYVFYRHYHLGHFQAMATVAEAFLDHHGVLQPTHGIQTNVFAYAKRDLRCGEQLDGLGGYACYGMIENCPGGKNPGLPICLAEDITLNKDVPKDAPIRMEDVVQKPDREDFKMYEKSLSLSPGR